MQIGFFLILFFGQISTHHPFDSQKVPSELTIEVNSGRKIVTRDLGRGLQIRVIKDRSVNNEDFGWIIEVVKGPRRKNTENLVYQNNTGTTADLSQVYAWQIGNDEFPNTRKLKAKGHPLVLTVRLVNVLSEGRAEDARFVSGKLIITWEWMAD